MVSTDSLLVFVPGPDEVSEPLKMGSVGGDALLKTSLRGPKLRLVRPCLEIAQPIVPVGGNKGSKPKESYSDEILRIALDRMISHAEHELMDDATRPFFDDAALAETAVQAVIEPKSQVQMGASPASKRMESSIDSQTLAETIA